jgi:DNA invertase Pin-like site-specific DNA recombinase
VQSVLKNLSENREKKAKKTAAFRCCSVRSNKRALFERKLLVLLLTSTAWEHQMTKRVGIYLRVSTAEQTTENQRRELEAVAERHKWLVVSVFEDAGISGAKGREQRPGLDALMKAVARREVDMVAAWSVDRLGRSLTGLLELLTELHAKKVDLYLHQQGLDTSTPSGKAMFQMMGVFAEFERAIIQERVRAGLARAKREGKQLGRPRIPAELETRIREALWESGRLGVRQLAKRFGVSAGTIQRISAAA